MELANFRAQNLPTFPDKNGFPSGATSKNLVIFGHLQGSSRVCTLHALVPLGEGLRFKLAYTRGVV